MAAGWQRKPCNERQANMDKIPSGCHENKRISRLRSNLLPAHCSALTLLSHNIVSAASELLNALFPLPSFSFSLLRVALFASCGTRNQKRAEEYKSKRSGQRIGRGEEDADRGKWLLQTAGFPEARKRRIRDVSLTRPHTRHSKASSFSRVEPQPGDCIPDFLLRGWLRR